MTDHLQREPSPHKQPEESKSGWAPIINHKIFLAFWIASIVSNLGSSIQDISASWLMTIQTQNPFFVSLIPAVASIAVILFIIPAGAFTDIFERRRLLLFIQGWMIITAVIMSIITLAGLMNPTLLLILTFILGIGTALNMPLAIVIAIEMTSQQEKQATITLGSVSINIGRAAGPIIGGIIIATAGGPGAAFLINALTFVLMFFVIYRWKRTIPKRTLPSEHVIEAIRGGVRYVIHSPQAQSMFVRASSFAIFGSVIAAVLPVLVEEELGLNSVSLGLLLGFLGIGAIFGGTIVLPAIRNKTSYQRIVIGSTILLAIVMILLAFVRDFTILSVAMGVGGIGWILIISSMHFSMSITSPKWVGPRGLSFYLLVFQGATAIGSIIWGSIADRFGIPYAFLFAAIGILLGLLTGLKYKLTADLDVEKEPSKHWPSPHVVFEPAPEDGPVLVKIEYNIDPSNIKEFTYAMKELSNIRKRDGALRWGLYKDDSNPNLLIETFYAESWAEHMRQHERMTIEDKKIQDKVNSFNIGSDPPAASHLIAEPLPKKEE
jgi:MFS family permease